jgi:hypothetical protein
MLFTGAWALIAAICLGSWLYPQWEAFIYSDTGGPPCHDTIWPRGVGMALGGVISVWAIFWLFMPLCRRVAQGAPWNSTSARVRSLVEGAALIAFALLLILLGLFVAPYAVYLYETVRDSLACWMSTVLKIKVPEYVTTALSGLATFLLGGLARAKGKNGFNWAGLLLFFLTPAFFLISFFVFASHLGAGGLGDWQIPWAAGLTAFLTLWVWVFLDVNTFAPHQFYRDRLCECYLAVKGRTQRPWFARLMDFCFRGGQITQTMKEDSVGTLKRLPLSELGNNAAAPYHLINATLNAAASKHPSLRGRDGDFFLFSKHFCGSPLSGYVETKTLEAADPHVDLGTAMAISGAAASTAMGDIKSAKQFRFLMTLFNVRLGYWLRRPGLKVGKGPGTSYFLRELFGAVHERGDYVNISDGGHIENLAAYELLRRRCKFIVCIDAGMEPGMECADLMRLQRYAAIDFGIDMQFDPADLTILPTSYSRAYAILVKIDYAPGQRAAAPAPGLAPPPPVLGWMLYVKLAITGTEPRYVLDYRREHPEFPHQTTAQQVYDEAQFEAYRALGECAAASLFRDELTGGKQPATVRDWFQILANNFLPDNDSAFPKKSG